MTMMMSLKYLHSHRCKGDPTEDSTHNLEPPVVRTTCGLLVRKLKTHLEGGGRQAKVSLVASLK